jgi:hypothetical protein
VVRFKGTRLSLACQKLSGQDRRISFSRSMPSMSSGWYYRPGFDLASRSKSCPNGNTAQCTWRSTATAPEAVPESCSRCRCPGEPQKGVTNALGVIGLLNELGADGWELVDVEDSVLYLKRKRPRGLAAS